LVKPPAVGKVKTVRFVVEAGPFKVVGETEVLVP